MSDNQNAIQVSMRALLEAGCHFGHQTRFWNPKMGQFIFGKRNSIHIINLEKTKQKLTEALRFIEQLSAQHGKILFVATKRSSREIVAEQAARISAPYIDQRWLGGMLTNFKTVKTSIKKLKQMDELATSSDLDSLTKKEVLLFDKNHAKAERALGGIKELNGMPDAIFVVDVGHHKIAISEAQKLGIPVIGIVDTNHSPEGIDYIIPSNDDSASAVECILSYVVEAVLAGRSRATNDIVKMIEEAKQDVQEDIMEAHVTALEGDAS